MSPTFSTEFDAAMESYLGLGYHLETNLWSDDECEELVEASHSFPAYQEGTFSSVMHPHVKSPVFLKALANPKLLAILRRIVRGPISGLQTQFFYGPPGGLGYSAHQDNMFVQAPVDGFISVWTALEDTDAQNGGLFVFPGSHREPILPTKEVAGEKSGGGPDPNANRIETVIPQKYKAQNLSVKKGSSVFIHANLIHASHQNTTQNKFRHSLLSTYIRSGATFRAGQNAKRTELNFG
jgi:phytanoyl-CoA hydroxylase